jgi:outer membrane protein assembly factor BamB
LLDSSAQSLIAGQAEVEIHESFSVYANPVETGNGEIAVFITTKGLLVAISITTQTVLCAFKLGYPVFSTPLVLSSDSKSCDIVIGSVDGALRRLVLALSHGVWSAEVVWTRPTPRPIFSSICVLHPSGASIVFGAHDGRLRCVQAVDGTVQWEIDLGSIIFASPLVVQLSDNSGSIIIAATTGGGLFVLRHNFDDQSGSSVKVLRSLKLSAELYSSAALLSDGSVCIGTRADKLMKFSI